MEKKSRKGMWIAVGLATVLVLSIVAYVEFERVEYQISGPFQFDLTGKYHLLVQVFDKNGKLISQKYHTLSETTYGRNLIKQLFANQTSYTLDWMACSNSTVSPSASSVNLTEEITGGNWTSGNARSPIAINSYVDSGTGTWNETFTFVAAAGVTVDTRLYGIYSQSTGNNLCLYEQQDPTYQHLNAGQTLNATLMGTVN